MSLHARQARRRAAGAATTGVTLVLIALPSCGHVSPSPSSGTPTDASVLDEPYYPDASCPVVIDSPPLLPAQHVPIGTPITWDSNPPSSGPHYPIWAAFQTYTKPVDLGYLVHDMEHGAVVFLYKCQDGGSCADVAAELASIVAELPSDALCAAQSASGVRVRAVITPDPLLDVPVAAAAWGWTYKAQCVDKPTLLQFALDHYGKGPETLCSDGQAQF
jgi:hypothetical protein